VGNHIRSLPGDSGMVSLAAFLLKEEATPTRRRVAEHNIVIQREEGGEEKERERFSHL